LVFICSNSWAVVKLGSFLVKEGGWRVGVVGLLRSRDALVPLVGLPSGRFISGRASGRPDVPR
jgi:hypothetical protein